MYSKKLIMYLADNGSATQRILAMAWLDADRGDWPLQNAGQRKALIEMAIEEQFDIHYQH